MNIKNNVKKFVLVVMSISLSQFLSAQVGAGEDTTAEKTSDKLNLVFEEISAEKTTGSTYYVDVESELTKDSRTDLGSLLNGKIPGMFDTYNTWGTGNAVIVVDGVRQEPYYYESLSMLEVESIIVLKDAVSKALYGAQGDQGVILINTKRGFDGPQKVRIGVDYSMSQPRALPNFLGAGDYMEKFNEALFNEGVDQQFLKFSQGMIDSTRLGTNSTRYPDNNFYTSDYLRDFRTDVNVFADVAGGNENARYYVSTGWSQSNGWLSTSIPDITNRFNFKSNLDFKINDYMKMAVDASARLNMNTSPNIEAESYWSEFSSILPNAYPVLWDPSEISNPETRDLLLEEANLIGNQVLGGSSSFANNQIMGNLIQNGKVRDQQRIVQFGGKMDVDLGFLTKGLTARVYAGMNFYNSLFTQQNIEYAIYEPIFNASTGALDTFQMHGVDRPSTSYNTNSDNSDSYRQLTYFGNLNYHRTFGIHDLSLVALIYNDEITQKGMLQNNTLFHTGLAGNYTINNRYTAEFSVMGIGSRKLAEGNRMEYAPSAGLAWIISSEDFMDNVSLVNFLKLRAAYGISKNDNWSHYFLYKNTFSRGSNFDYYNGTHENNETVYESYQNNIYLQKRKDISVGLDAVMLDNSLNLNLGYFMSTSLDNITMMSSTYPDLMGFEDLIYENYNSDRTNGVEMGMSYTYKTSGGFSATIGGNLLHISPKILKYEEPAYEGLDAALLREGTATDALWALVADGLYSEDDFNADGTLADGLPLTTYGAVQAGDIKYVDQNGDNIIDQRDQRIVGHNVRTQYSAYLNLRYKNLGLYVMGIGRLGDSDYRSGSYFRVFGDVKFSEYALQAYGPDNKDVNAIHPRLATSSGGHSDRNSSYWVYENNSFTLPVVQLTYHFKGTNGLSFLNQSRAYIRGTNLVVLNKNKEYSEVNPSGAPRLRSIVLGLVTSF
jgi:TonB-linked SusC/RagA family outer membrane protein